MSTAAVALTPCVIVMSWGATLKLWDDSSLVESVDMDPLVVAQALEDDIKKWHGAVVVACKGCKITQRIVYADVSSTDAEGHVTTRPQAQSLDWPETKPMDTYVFSFEDATWRRDWLNAKASALKGSIIFVVFERL